MSLQLQPFDRSYNYNHSIGVIPLSLLILKVRLGGYKLLTLINSGSGPFSFILIQTALNIYGNYKLKASRTK